MGERTFSAAERLQRQVSSRFAADVEMLMKPALRRNEQTSRLPVVAFNILAFAPHHRETLTPENDDVGAGAVAMSFFVGTDRKLGDMCRHDVVGHLDHQHPAAGAALFSFRQLVTAHVANKVRIVKPFSGDLCPATKKILFAGVAVSETIVAVKDEVDIMIEIQHRRRIGHCQKPHWFVALPVEVLIPSVEGRREERAFAPLEGSFLAVLLPDSRRAAPTDDIDQLFEHMLLRFYKFAGCDFADVAIID